MEVPLGKSQMFKKWISHNYEVAVAGKESFIFMCILILFIGKSNDKNQLYTIFLMIYISNFFTLINCNLNELLYNYLQYATHGTYYFIRDFEFYGNSAFHFKVNWIQCVQRLMTYIFTESLCLAGLCFVYEGWHPIC